MGAFIVHGDRHDRGASSDEQQDEQPDHEYHQGRGVPTGATVPCRSEVAEYPAATWWCLDQGISCRPRWPWSAVRSRCWWSVRPLLA